MPHFQFNQANKRDHDHKVVRWVNLLYSALDLRYFNDFQIASPRSRGVD